MSMEPGPLTNGELATLAASAMHLDPDVIKDCALVVHSHNGEAGCATRVMVLGSVDRGGLTLFEGLVALAETSDAVRDLLVRIVTHL